MEQPTPARDGCAPPEPSALPKVVIVGRPNVGKSTLFNRLCRNRAALVADVPGLTRDRHEGHAELDDRPVVLVDTGGIEDVAADQAAESKGGSDRATLHGLVAEQVDAALEDADVGVLVVDARDGLTDADVRIALDLRRRGLAVVVAANKIDGISEMAAYDFAALGFDPLPISAAHGRGVAKLASAIAAQLPAQEALGGGVEETSSAISARVEVAVVGRPNVGKSTLVNRLLGEKRQVVSDRPGTTRDAIGIAFGRYSLIDTAGVRRKGRVAPGVEKLSVMKTRGALDRAAVALVVLDGREGIVDQDLHILSAAVEAGAGVLLAVNKCDGLDANARRALRDAVARRVSFAPWLPVRFISALRGSGVSALLADADAIHRAGMFDVKTAELNRILAEAIREQPPPLARSRPVKLRYAHKGGSFPPTVIVHGNQTEALPASYLRFLGKRFRTALGLVGVVVKVEAQTVENPFAGRRNELNRRQQKRRQRLIRHRQGR